MNIKRIVDRRLMLAAELLASNARSSFTQKSGTPSSPGEYPAKQTGELAESISVTEIQNGYNVRINAEHAKYLSDRKLLLDVWEESKAEIMGIVK